jgi:hypothetical protein
MLILDAGPKENLQNVQDFMGWFPAFGFKEGGKGTRVFGYSLLGVTDTPIQAVPAEKEIYEGKGYIISVTSQYIIQ